MTQLTQQILSLSEDLKVHLIHALSEQVCYPNAHQGLRYYGLDDILELEPQIWSLSTDEKRSLIKAMVNAL
jgi:hypothetical protein